MKDFMRMALFTLAAWIIINLVGCTEPPTNPGCQTTQSTYGTIIICPGRPPILAPKGEKGDKGDKGDTGAKGPKGDSGTSCHTFPDVEGAVIECDDGTTSQVYNGAKAEPCTTSVVAGGVLVSCPDGSTQTILNGSNGISGTLVTPVKFCSNYVTTYPTSFPEYGFCINNKLYAVYWNGSQAFEAEIPPGAYASTSPQGCNFNVLPNCVIGN